MAKMIRIFLFGLLSQAPSLLCKFFRISNGGGQGLHTLPFWDPEAAQGSQPYAQTWLPSDSETPISRRLQALAEKQGELAFMAAIVSSPSCFW